MRLVFISDSRRTALDAGGASSGASLGELGSSLAPGPVSPPLRQAELERHGFSGRRAKIPACVASSDLRVTGESALVSDFDLWPNFCPRRNGFNTYQFTGREDDEAVCPSIDPDSVLTESRRLSPRNSRWAK